MKLFSSQIHRTFTEQIMSLRSSNQRCSINSVLEGFLIKLAWNLREACNFIKKEILPQVFSCAFCEISKNTFFTEHLWTTASGVFRVIGFLKKIDNSSADKFLSLIPVSDWLIFCFGNLIPHYRCANADSKISPNVCVPMKIIPWEFSILNRRNSRVIIYL